MEITRIAISELKPYGRHAHNSANAVRAVAESIRRFGFKQPLVVDEQGVNAHVVEVLHIVGLAVEHLQGFHLGILTYDSLPLGVFLFALLADNIGKFGGASVLLKRAPEGTGVIAGGPARAVIELAGIKNIRTKSLGSNNKQNVVFATLNGLKGLKTPEEVARLRGKSVSDILA